jgi:hypothetical protein
MERLWLASLVVFVLSLPAQAAGMGAGGQGVGMPEWAMGLRADTPAAAQHESAVGQALGGAVGLSDDIRERLTNRQSLGAAVGLSDALRERLMEQGALGMASAASDEIQQRLMNRETLGAAVGMPEQIRERLMAGLGQE